MTFDENKVARDKRGKFDEKTGAQPDITLEDPTLDNALTRYNLALEDIPLDHEGQSITARWEERFAVLNEPQADTVETFINNELDLDYGRHRGGPWLAWPEDNASFLEDWPAVEPEDNWEGREGPVAVVHTRNGGGNRECWCDDDDDHDCLVSTIQAMQDHPAYITDADDSGDPTYANFAFKVDREKAQTVYNNRDLANRQLQARNLHRAIADGKQPPWAVFPTNPNVAERIAAIQAEDFSLREQSDVRRLPSKMEVRGVLSEEHAAQLKARLKHAKKGGEAPPTDRNLWVYDRFSDSAVIRQRYEKKAAEEASRVAAVAELAKPDIAPELRAIYEDALNSSFALKNAETDFMAAKVRWKNQVEAMETDYAAIKEALRVRAHRAELKDKLTALRADQHWPGENPPSVHLA